MANFCSNCGKPLKPSANFCPSCGTKVRLTSDTTQNSSNTSGYDDIISAGAGALAGAAIATTNESSQAQAANVTAANVANTSTNSANEVLDQFFGFVSDNLLEITGTVDVTNIVANVANAFGVTDVAEYIDIATEGANELIDSASDAVADTAGDALDSLLDFLG